jgi:hypothetical protein
VGANNDANTAQTITVNFTNGLAPGASANNGTGTTSGYTLESTSTSEISSTM